MEKICLVEAGNYLLGIDAAAIMGKTDMDSLVKGERVDDLALIFLDPFFRQDQACLPHSDLRVMELRDGAGSFFLALDTIRGEVPVGSHLEALPILYPAAARRCCPRIMMYGEEPVMLMDIAGLQALLELMGTDCGVSTLGTLRRENQARILNEVSTDLDKSEDSQEDEQPSGLDDVQFREVVAWAMGHYLDGCQQGSLTSDSAEFPQGYTEPQHVQGVDRELWQRLARQVVRKCGSFQHSAVQRLNDELCGGRP